VNSHERPAVETLLAGLEIHRFREIEEDGKTAVGAPKHWHFFEILAQKSG